jgi:2,3-bisphosphoglycerate-dependent phosphoglycerate mutase
LRALIMGLEGISGPEIVKLELATGVPIVYTLNADSTVATKEVLAG